MCLLAKTGHHPRQCILSGSIAECALQTPPLIQADVAGFRVANLGSKENSFLSCRRKCQMRKIQNLAGFKCGNPLVIRRSNVPVGDIDMNDFIFHEAHYKT